MFGDFFASIREICWLSTFRVNLKLFAQRKRRMQRLYTKTCDTTKCNYVTLSQSHLCFNSLASFASIVKCFRFLMLNHKVWVSFPSWSKRKKNCNKNKLWYLSTPFITSTMIFICRFIKVLKLFQSKQENSSERNLLI